MKALWGRAGRLVLLLLLSVVTVAVLTDLLLRLFLPYDVATIGHRRSPNARKYGWGYNPNELVRTLDPDTGQTYLDRVNGRGWRDVDRTIANEKRAYRILVLGDSVTFGSIVPGDKVYTRLLEQRLQSDGYNAEVLNIAYGGWGTDQEVEALRLEGLAYDPHLVILQFSPNDLTDNVWFLGADAPDRLPKPFFYTLGSDGRPVRNSNPSFKDLDSYGERFRALVTNLQLVKRLYGAYLLIQLRAAPQYIATENQIRQLRVLLHPRADDPLFRFLERHRDQALDETRLLQLTASVEGARSREAILRVLENRWFHRDWSEEGYCGRRQDVGSLPWRSYFALVAEAQRMVEDRSGRLVLLSERDAGGYDWEASWFRIASDEACRERFLAPTRMVREYALAHGIGFVENTARYVRARNDPHPNVRGNQALADNIYEYLMRHHREEMDAFRTRPAPP
jgi:lysophospholipase L1-like esterase